MTSDNTNTTEHLLQSHQRAQLFAIFGVPLLSFFGLVALSNREWPLLLLIATSLLTICGSYLAIERGRASPVTLWMAIVSFTVLLIYLVAFSGQEHGRALWFFALLLLAGMMLPPRQGATWAGISIATAAAIMLLGGPEFGTSDYSTSFTIRFVITAILISVGIFWSEKTLLRYKDEAAAQKAATQADSERLKAEIARRVALEVDLRVQASTDALTGLINRRAFMDRFAHERARSQRHGPSPTLLMLDIDHFKKINDKFGHPAGDAVLAHLAQLLKSSVRNVDIVGRIGGEEFAVVLVETNAQMAAPVIERLLERLRKTTVPLADATQLKFTASIGSTEILWADTIDTAIQRADEALYTAKKSGRDRHCLR
jgi:diguanylate cyclase (GGDEF)-like protein